MHIALAPFTLMAGVSEEQVLDAEQNSEGCEALFSSMDDDGCHRVVEILRTNK